MQLKKILEEIKEILEDNKVSELNSDGTIDKCVIDAKLAWDYIKDIIRKHMNDGWIPVEKRLPEDDIPTPKLVTALVPDRKARWDNSETFSVIVDTDVYDPDYTGKWECYKKNVIAWRPLPDPYRPERSTE